MLQSFLQNILNALQWGSFYSLIALGYCLVYGVLLLINFAHGDIFMVGAYIAFFCSMFLLGKFGAFAYYCWAVGVLTLVLNVIK